MYCKNCGTENDNDAKFCKSCGAKIDNINTETAENRNINNSEITGSDNSNNTNSNPEKDRSHNKNNPNNNGEKGKNSNKNIILIAAAAVICLVAAFVFFSRGGSSANMEKVALEFALNMEAKDYNSVIGKMKWPEDTFGSDETKLNYLKYLYNSDFAGVKEETAEQSLTDKNLYVLHLNGDNGDREVPLKIKKENGKTKIELTDLKEGKLSILSPTESSVYVDGEQVSAEKKSDDVLGYSIFTIPELLYGDHSLKITIPTFKDYDVTFNLQENSKSVEYLNPEVTEETKRQIEEIGYEAAKNWEYSACWNKPFESVSSHFYSDPEYNKELKNKYNELVQFFMQDDGYLPFTYDVYEATDCRLKDFYYDTSFPLFIGMDFDVDYYAEGYTKVQDGLRHADRFNMTDTINVLCTYADGKWIIADIKDEDRESRINELKKDKEKGYWFDYGNFRNI